MLIRILNTLPSRIWDVLFFLFSDYLNLQFGEKGDSTDGYGFSGKSKGLTHFFWFFRFLRQNKAFSATEQNQTYKNSLFLRNLNAFQQKDTHFWGNPLFFLHKNPNFIWRQRTENRKLDITFYAILSFWFLFL